MAACNAAERALTFIQLQLVELAKDCGQTIKNSLVNSDYFVELETKLEKILHETRSVCNPPPRKPVSSDFDMVKVVNSGTFGTVNLVRHKETGQAFAMKQIKPQSMEQRNYTFLERDILTYLNNPSIVSMFCSFETASELFMVMEYVGGGDCESLLQRCESFPLDVATTYLAETVLAVEYIHNYGIVHRDVKPANLLISHTGHIKLADFGLSTIGPVNMAGDMRRPGLEGVAKEFLDDVVVGTAEFIAPEVLFRKGYGKPVDWWAIGIILYNFLVGSPPFLADSPENIFHQVINDDVIWPDTDMGDNLPTVAKDFITLLLEKDCFKRLGTRGADEVKSHAFFCSVDWNNLLDQAPPFVPKLKDEEDTSYFEMCPPPSLPHMSACCHDQNTSPVDLPEFCSVASRFKDLYGSPAPLSPCSLLSAKAGHETQDHDTIKLVNNESTVDDKSSEDSNHPSVDDESTVDDTSSEDSNHPSVDESTGDDTSSEDSNHPSVDESTVDDTSSEDSNHPSVDDESTVDDTSSEDSNHPSVDESTGNDTSSEDSNHPSVDESTVDDTSSEDSNHSSVDESTVDDKSSEDSNHPSVDESTVDDKSSKDNNHPSVDDESTVNYKAMSNSPLLIVNLVTQLTMNPVLMKSQVRMIVASTVDDQSNV